MNRPRGTGLELILSFASGITQKFLYSLLKDLGLTRIIYYSIFICIYYEDKISRKKSKLFRLRVDLGQRRLARIKWGP